MKKNIKLLSVLMILVLSATVLFAGCGKKTETLEDYAAKHSEVQQEIDEAFANSGLDGSAVIEGNNIKMTVDITSLLGEGLTLDDNTKELLRTSFDTAFDDAEGQLVESLKKIEENTKISGITMQVIVTYGDEVVFDRTFSVN